MISCFQPASRLAEDFTSVGAGRARWDPAARLALNVLGKETVDAW
jgi:hypothetical protein